MKTKYKMGQTDRCINETKPKKVIGITENSGYFYDVERYGGDVNLRVAEVNLVDFKTGK